MPFPDDAPHRQCRLCSSILDEEYAFQKYGHAEDDSALPAAANQLVLVKDLRPLSGRALHLKQCPACGTYYLYRTDYEYLVDGTEDEQFLTRLTTDQAAEHLGQA